MTLATAGRLRVGVWTLPFFAHERDGALHGLVPDLANALARRLGATAALVAYSAPAPLVEAFRAGALDVTFIGVTAERAAVIDFGPVLFDIETAYLVPGGSAIAQIGDVDRAGVRIAVPAPSAQEAHLRRTLTQAALLPVPPEDPQAALDLLARGDADAFSHVAPVLAQVRHRLPGARVLPGSSFNVPIAIGVTKGRPPQALELASAFAVDAKASGILARAIARAGVSGLKIRG